MNPQWAVPVPATPTLDTAIYATGDVLFGSTALSEVMATEGASAELESLLLVDKSGQAAAMTILILDAAPAGTYTPNAAFSWTAADRDKVVGVIDIQTGDWKTVNGVSSILLGGIAALLKSAATQNLWILGVVNGTPTFAGASDLRLVFGFNRRS